MIILKSLCIKKRSEKEKDKKNIVKFHCPSFSDVVCYLNVFGAKLLLLLMSNCILKKFKPVSSRDIEI